jgi:hypothetical protein
MYIILALGLRGLFSSRTPMERHKYPLGAHNTFGVDTWVNVEWCWQGKAEELGQKHVPLPLCPPQVPNRMTRARIRSSAVGFQRLSHGTAWIALLLNLLGCELDDPGCILYRPSLFSPPQRSDRLWDAHSLLSCWNRNFFWELQWPEREANRSPV